MADDPARQDRARSFDRGAQAYGRARPSYPDDAVRWCVPEGAHRVLDLAAGTGKLTAVLVAHGFDVTAVEPSRAMREQLTSLLPDVTPRPGTAEDTGLPTASVDAVTVAQAWHWFDEAAASAEIARVLRPGGTLALLWNVRDPSVDWVARFGEIIHRGDAHEREPAAPLLGDRFDAPEHATFPWTDRVAVRTLRMLAASRSHLLTLPAERREELLDEVDELGRTHPDLRGRDEVDLPYRTVCWRARVRG
ncbi:class I SAM-dependent methyltransferase [Cellulomonas cellasea]|uniref:SAM-dependent methyltransferase n=1 Tax=Cellulomonas cellasea TaxID=43670 RepID=A0A7W4UBT6_9CELL|nr:class I SAM-dependent methyltransferase [Cellulomonas cellasea]MBB2921197.1 SAM-dependent methyltransferase [Cellulomonas cellasea]